ncbi:MAG: hypothetical protein V1798_08230 [Pseudomonadota bacterium]
MRAPRLNPMSGSVALVLVLVTLAVISTVVIEIMYRSQVTATVVMNRRDSEKAYELARAAVRWSMFRLQLDKALDSIPAIPGTNYGGPKDDLQEFQWAVPLPYPFSAAAAAAAMGEGAKVSEDRQNAGEKAKEAKQMEALGGSFLSVIHDESSKINLNDVGSGGFGPNRRWSGTAEVLENLLLSPRFKGYFRDTDHRNVLWAIDDWTDMDSEINHLGGGVEDVEYQTEDRNLHVKNGPFYSVDEVRLIRPMTDDLFRELKPFITVYPFDARYPRGPGLQVNEIGHINVNTAPLEVIAAIFNREVLPGDQDRFACAQEIVKFRKNVVFRSTDSGGKPPSFLDTAAQLCKVSARGQQGTPEMIRQAVRKILSVASDTFFVEATGIAENTDRTILTVLSRQDPAKPPKILYWKVI